MEQIRLRILSTQYIGEEENGPIEFITEGVKYEKDGKLQIEYEESPDGIGFEHIRTRIEIEGERVTMMRNGPLKSNMVFEKGRKFEGNYVTPFGLMKLDVFASSVEVSTRENLGTIDLEYEMAMNSLHTYNKLFLKYETIGERSNMNVN